MSYYKIKDLENYFKMYKKSVREPRKFWDKIADEEFTWYQKWDKTFEFDMQEANFKWFVNGKLNIVKNCIDTHLNKNLWMVQKTTREVCYLLIVGGWYNFLCVHPLHNQHTLTGK